MTSNVEAMRRLFRIDEDDGANLPLLRAIFPGMDAPVVRQTADGRRELTVMHWGFVLALAGKAPKDVTNARDDKVLQSRFWRPSFEARRCLVPATSFAEPKGRKPAVWHWFALKGEEPRPLFAFAGLWRRWKGEYRGEQREMETFAFLTTAPNEVVRPVHPNRMPVILRPADHEAWLNGSTAEARALAQSFPGEEMQIVHRGDKSDPG